MKSKYLKVDGHGTCMGDFQEVFKIIYDKDLDENTVDIKLDSIIEEKYSKYCCSQCFPSTGEISEEKALKAGIDEEIIITC